MHKKCITAVFIMVFTMLITVTSFAVAGTWTQAEDGSWKYVTVEGYMFHDTFTDDGYWVGSDGSWIPSTVPADVLAERSANGARVIAVSKAGHAVELWQDGTLVKSYKCSTGKADGDKEMEGDGKTPNGEFYICLMNTRSAYTRGIGISYPSAEDAERGLNTGLITQAQYNSIVNANTTKAKPNWYTNLGGEIELHGGFDLVGNNASRGCIVMTNADILDLFSRVAYGDSVLIYE